MAEIFGLRRKAPTPSGGSPEIIAVLEETLLKAGRGDVIALGMVIVSANKDIHTIARNPSGNRHVLVAGCEYLKADIIDAEQKERI